MITQAEAIIDKILETPKINVFENNIHYRLLPVFTRQATSSDQPNDMILIKLSKRQKSKL